MNKIFTVIAIIYLGIAINSSLAFVQTSMPDISARKCRSLNNIDRFLSYFTLLIKKGNPNSDNKLKSKSFEKQICICLI
jgi:hypothetical protein